MRFIFIGDIHGCIDEFQELVRLVDVRPEDQVVCLGDFMDKGPDPAGCVRFARESGFRSILGNHEEKHIKWRQNEARAKADPTYTNRMRPFSPEKAAQNAALSDEDVAWLQALPILLEPLPGFVVVHGGLFPGLTLEEQPQDKILRARYVNAQGEHMPSDFESLTPVPPGGRHWATVYDGTHNVIYGHEAHSLSTVRQDRNLHGVVCYGIDTGCVHGGRLTAMIVEDSRVSFMQVQARRMYKGAPWPILS
jgi:bis(5'-nucleosyl)-tetraphosphatase (symmetrical)